MTSTIRNPIEWTADQLNRAWHHAEHMEEAVAGEVHDPKELPRTRPIAIDDLRDVLRKGVEDFAACRTDVAFLCIIYPVAGFLITVMAFQQALVPLIFPAVAGFTLLGPFLAIGLYELSRQREAGREANWATALEVFASPALGAIVVLGALLLGIFVCWILVAYGIFAMTLGPQAPESISAFASAVLTTKAGWAMILIGFSVGFVFAAVVLAISVISFPLLLDRNVGVPAAIVTSVRVAAENPRAIATWGLIVAGSLAIGSIPAFLGLMIVMPVLGHATWHLYRRAVPRSGEKG